MKEKEKFNKEKFEVKRKFEDKIKLMVTSINKEGGYRNKNRIPGGARKGYEGLGMGLFDDSKMEEDYPTKNDPDLTAETREIR